MDGHTYAVLIASVAVIAAAFDVIRVYRRLPPPERPAGDAGSAVAGLAEAAPQDAVPIEAGPAEAVPPAHRAAAERNFGLVVVSRAVFVALALIAAGMYWNAEDDQNWTQSKVVNEAEKIAADMERGGQAPGDGATPGEGSFKTLVDTEVQGIVKGNGLGLTDDWATPPPGAVDSYVLTGTKTDDRTGEAKPTKYRACLVITAANPVPNGLPTSSGISDDVHDYAIHTKVTSGRC